MRRRLGPAPFHPRTSGRLVVVGGHTRGVGKTALVEHLLKTWRSRPIAAVKVSAHRHAPEAGTTPLIEEAFAASTSTQTGRYLAAGAAHAWLCRCPTASLPHAARFVEGLRTSGCDVIVESNRLVEHVTPDLVFFVVSDLTDDWKPSSEACLRRADALVLSVGTARVPASAKRLGWAAGRGRAVFSFDDCWATVGIGR